jgi:hypothetical protein
MKVGRVALAVLTVALVAGAAGATFRAADLVVIPVAANLGGVSGSYWQTDLEIMNVDTVAVDVMVVFLPTGGSDNASWYSDIANHLGGRADDGFGHLDERLKDIQPGATVNVEDIVQTWGTSQKGALLLFAYQAGTLTTTDPKGGTPKKIVVNARTYTTETVSGTTVTYGQGVPGLPWYDYISPNLKSKGLDHVVFTGLREDDSYRTALGLVNVSDRLTSLQVTITILGPDGVMLKEATMTILPLSHQQIDRVLKSFFQLPYEQTTLGLTAKVAVKSWISSNADPTPALMCYVSRVDNTTNDPSFIEQTYENELPWDCVFNGNCTSVSTALKALASRPLSHLRPPIGHGARR